MLKNERAAWRNQENSWRLETRSDRCLEHHRRNGGSSKKLELQQGAYQLVRRRLPIKKELGFMVQWINWKMQPTWAMVNITGNTKIPLYFILVQPYEFPDCHYAKDIKRENITIGQHVTADKRDVLQVGWRSHSTSRKRRLYSRSDSWRSRLVIWRTWPRRLLNRAKTQGAASKAASGECNITSHKGQESLRPVRLSRVLHDTERPYIHF